MNILPHIFLALAFTTSLTAGPVEITPAELRGSQQPQAAIGPKGEIHVVFGRKSKVYHTVSTDEARTFRAPVAIATLSDLALGMHRGPRVAIAGDRIIVTASSRGIGDLLAWTSADGGATWAWPATLNSASEAAREGLQALAANGQRVAAAWLDQRGSGTELWAALSEDGGTTWQRDALLYRSPDGSICQCCAPSLAFGSHGELAAMWRNSLGGARDPYLALSQDGGRTFAEAAKLGSGTWKPEACPMDGGGLAFLRNATAAPVTIWRRESKLFLASPGEPERELGEGKDAALATTAHGPVMAWQSKDGLMIQLPGAFPRLLDAQGVAPCLTASPDSNFAVIVWETGEVAQRVLKAEILR